MSTPVECDWLSDDKYATQEHIKPATEKRPPVPTTARSNHDNSYVANDYELGRVDDTVTGACRAFMLTSLSAQPPPTIRQTASIKGGGSYFFRALSTQTLLMYSIDYL